MMPFRIAGVRSTEQPAGTMVGGFCPNIINLEKENNHV